MLSGLKYRYIKTIASFYWRQNGVYCSIQSLEAFAAFLPSPGQFRLQHFKLRQGQCESRIPTDLTTLDSDKILKPQETPLQETHQNCTRAKLCGLQTCPSCESISDSNYIET